MLIHNCMLLDVNMFDPTLVVLIETLDVVKMSTNTFEPKYLKLYVIYIAGHLFRVGANIHHCKQRKLRTNSTSKSTNLLAVSMDAL